MLTDIAIKALKPKDKIYKVADRDGLYVAVTPAGDNVAPYVIEQTPGARRLRMTLEVRYTT